MPCQLLPYLIATWSDLTLGQDVPWEVESLLILKRLMLRSIRELVPQHRLPLRSGEREECGWWSHVLISHVLFLQSRRFWSKTLETIGERRVGQVPSQIMVRCEHMI
jgi:hypothetical protein